MATYVVPSDTDVKNALAMFFGEDTVIGEGENIALDSKEAFQAADFISPEGETVAAFVCDLPLTAYAGAALTMIPAAGAEDAVKTGDVSKLMLDNTYEVVNIISQFLMNNHTPHLKLSKMYSAKEAPDALKEMVGKTAEQISFKVDIPNYGSGNISIMIT